MEKKSSRTTLREMDALDQEKGTSMTRREREVDQQKRGLEGARKKDRFFQVNRQMGLQRPLLGWER